MLTSRLQEEFFGRLASAADLARLFDYLPHAYFFVKDLQHRFVKVSEGELRLHGFANESDMLGKTDFDLHPPALAAQYVEEDRQVMASRRVRANQVWLVAGGDGLPRWYQSTKMPLLDRQGEVIGIAGVMHPYDQGGDAKGEYQRMTPAMQFVLTHYRERITVAAMAKRASLSVSHLQREFQRLFGMTPSDYLLRVRLSMARRQLEQTSDPAGLVALHCGFYDQSHFTRAFRAATGLRPIEYRRRFGGGKGTG